MIIARRTFICLYLAVQILVPAILLLASERPTRFGWQMFTGSRQPRFWRLSSDGSRIPVSLVEVREIVGVVRSELDYEQYVPPQLCQRQPSAIAIESERGRGVRQWPCR
jgi:hypothetical protein